MVLARGPAAPPNVFVVGLQPDRRYLVEVDDEELSESQADKGASWGFSRPATTRAGSISGSPRARR